MAVTVRIPGPLRRLTQGEGELQVEAQTVGEALAILRQRYPQLGQRLFDGEGQLKPFVNVYLDDEDIRFLQELDTPLTDGAVLTLVPAMSGGDEKVAKNGREGER